MRADTAAEIGAWPTPIYEMAAQVDSLLCTLSSEVVGMRGERGGLKKRRLARCKMSFS